MKTGDKIKYTFPDPNIAAKEFITGMVLNVSTDRITVRCDDNSILNISFKNYQRIEIMETEDVLE